MTKKKYLRRLRKALGKIPEREKDKLVEYYAELIDEAYERGKTTKEVFADLESPDQVARDYFNANEGAIGGFYDPFEEPRTMPRREREPRRAPPPRREEAYDYDPPRQKPAKKGRNPFITILLIPVYIVAFCLGLAAILAAAGIVIASGAVILALFASGVFAIVMSFGIIGVNGAIAAAQIGAGILLVGLSLFAGLLIGPIARACGRFSVWLMRGFRSSDKVRVARSHGGIVATVAVALVLVIAGGAAGAFGMGKLDWNWRNLAVTGDVVEHSEALSLESVTALTVQSDNVNLKIVSTDGEAKFEYADFEDMAKHYSFADGVIKLFSEDESSSYLQKVWTRGVLFPVVESLSNQATLYLPKSYSDSFTVTMNNGTLTMEEMTLGNVKLETDNGAITVENCTFDELSVRTNNGAVVLENIAAGTVTAETDNGAVSFEEVTAAKISAKTDNGAITLEKISGDELSFKVGNGAVSGSIAGNKSDYTIDASTGLGSCNLSSQTAGEKSLYVRTGCGAIEIRFEN